MAYFKTSYDASSTTLSIDDEQVARALGVLALPPQRNGSRSDNYGKA